MIVYLVGPTLAAGVEAAESRGWHRINAFRFVTPTKHDIRIVTRIGDLIPAPGQTLLIKAPDYDAGPPESDPVGREVWLGRDDEGGLRAQFDAFVASGRARWVSNEAEIPVNRGTEFADPQTVEAGKQF